jgi:hypothetical protein
MISFTIVDFSCIMCILKGVWKSSLEDEPESSSWKL